MENTGTHRFFSSKDKQNHFESISGFQERVLSDNNIKFFWLTRFVATFYENSQNDVRLYKQQPCQSHGQSKDA